MNKNVIEILQEHLESISSEINLLKEKMAVLLIEKEKAQTALNEVTGNKRKHRPVVYNEKSLFKQKIIYCLRRERKILTANQMLQILFEVDDVLKVDEKKTENSLRLALFRLTKSDGLVSYKDDNMKAIHYALKSWIDENGNIEDEYIP